MLDEEQVAETVAKSAEILDQRAVLLGELLVASGVLVNIFVAESEAESVGDVVVAGGRVRRDRS